MPLEAVVPYIGTWIETKTGFLNGTGNVVVPYIGTWIETPEEGVGSIQDGRTLYRYVD